MSNIILACHISGVYDVNRNATLEDDDFKLVKNWVDSLVITSVHGVIFHNNFTDATCKKFENDYVSFVKVEYDERYNPNIYRYFVYNLFLKQNIHLLKNIFVTDVTDVVLVKNPFIDDFFVGNPEIIFCGDEPKKLNNDWMHSHSTNLRNKISDFSDYENRFKEETLLNCGIIGGKAALIFNFIKNLCRIHELANQENHTAYTGDMGAFNYLARTKFNTQLKFGAPINTIFKMYEIDRTDCWFRHK